MQHYYQEVFTKIKQRLILPSRVPSGLQSLLLAASHPSFLYRPPSLSQGRILAGGSRLAARPPEKCQSCRSLSLQACRPRVAADFSFR